MPQGIEHLGMLMYQLPVTCLKKHQITVAHWREHHGNNVENVEARHIKMAVAVPLITPAVFWLSTHKLPLGWTGFGSTVIASLQTKTVWDWMELLLMPLVLVGGVLLLTRSRRQIESRRSEENASVEREIASDNQKEEAVQAYFDRMADLVLKEKLSKFSPEEVKTVARVRTLTILRGLDSKRKGRVLCS